jgi:DNA-binding NtrC family response regulator
MKILVADDEKMKRVTLAQDLTGQGHEVATAADGIEALEQLKAGRFDVVITDLKMPKIDGIELLKQIKRDPAADTEVIIMTAYGSIPLAVEAGKLGAYDFVTKPFRNEDIFPLLAQIQAVRRMAAPPEDETPESAIDNIEQAVAGHSAAMQRVRRMIQICVRSDANVLLFGETGTGKDLIASAIHRNSQHRTFPFVKVGCTLFPSQLIESELYGHERGSFTGADQRRAGRFELAEGGTLYLDDVDDIPMEHQAKLLRAIEEKTFERVGGTTPIRANVRIVASTKRNLQRHDWPGNVREFLHVLQRAYLVGSGTISGKLLLAEIDGLLQKQPAASGPFQATIDRTERELLEGALQAVGGNKNAAAVALGMKPSTFRDKLAKHGLG